MTEEDWQAMSHAVFATLADGTQIGWNGIGGVPFFAPDIYTGNLRLPDLRGMYAEAAGFDGLETGGVHGDGIRNIDGGFSNTTGLANASASGAFILAAFAALDVPSTRPFSSTRGFSFASSRVVPTANKNQPRAWGALACVYLGLPAA